MLRSLSKRTRIAGAAAILLLCSAAVAWAVFPTTPVSTGAPVISGAADVGTQLSTTDGTWDNAPTNYAYQWRRCDSAGYACSAIGDLDATDDGDYTVTGDDVGHRLRVTVTALNADGSGSRISGATLTVGALTNTVAPRVSGTPAVGSALATTDGTWSGAATNFSYRWQRCNTSGSSCTPISGADASDDGDYTPTLADEGKGIRAAVTAYNASGSNTRLSNVTKPVVGAPTLVKAGTISGKADEGIELTVTDGTWSPTPTGVSYAWQRCDAAGYNCSPIGGADATDDNDYTATASDLSYRLRVLLTATNSAGSHSRLSDSTRPIGSPAHATSPQITGDAEAGSQLTVSDGTWDPAASSYDYAWKQCDADGKNCVAINDPDANDDNDYTVNASDVGHRLRAYVTAHNAYGSATRMSLPTAVVIPYQNKAPVVTVNSASSRSYTEGDGAVAIEPADLTVSDVDSTTLSTATIQVTGNYQSGQDFLQFVDTADIVKDGVFDTATGTLTLKGAGGVAKDLSTWQSALRAVTYANTSDDPDTSNRSIAFKVDDGGSVNHESAAATKTVTVAAVNDAPSFTSTNSGSTDEDTPLNGSVTASDAEGDSISFSKKADPGHGTVTVNADGSFTYTPAANYYGGDSFDVTADDGNSGTTDATFSITVNSVNDKPVVDASGGTTAYTENDAAKAIDTGLTLSDVDSPNLSAATITITDGLATAEDALSFADTADIVKDGAYDAATGTLKLKGAGGAAKPLATWQAALRSVKYANSSEDPSTTTRKVTFQVDDGGSANNVSDTDFQNVSVTRVNDAPQPDADSYANALGNTRYVMSDDTAASGPHTRNSTSGDVLQGDTDVDSTGLTAVGETITSTNCTNPCTGNVTMETDGEFVYDPPPGYEGNDTFTYKVTDNDNGDGDGAKQSNGTVTVDVGNGTTTWYVKKGATGDGRSHSPSDLPALTTGGSLDAKDDPSDRIFVYDDASAYTGGLVLETGQQLLGEPQGLSVTDEGGTPHSLVSAGATRPVITNSGGDVVTLDDGATVDSVQLDPSGAGNGGIFSGAAVTGGGTITVDNVFVNDTGTAGTGPGIELTDPSNATATFALSDVDITTQNAAGLQSANVQALSVTGSDNDVSATGGAAVDVSGTSGATLTFDQVTSTNSSGDGIDLGGMGGGTFTAGNSASAITNAAGIDFDLDDGTGNVTYNGTITDDVGQLVDVTNTDNGVKDFNGAISDGNDGDGAGINLVNNTGATVRFDGGLSVATNAGTALNATGGGTLAVTGSNNTLNATGSSNRALNVTNTTIHDDDLTFRNISASGAANGIVLSSTSNANGRLDVTGTGVQPSGGTINNTVGAGIDLGTVPGGAAFDGVAITNGLDDGLRATTVDGLTLTDSLVDNNGNSHSGGIEERGLDWLNVTGTASVVNTTVQTSDDSNAHIRNTSGTTNLTVTNSTFAQSDFNAGLRIRGEGSSTMTAVITGSTFARNADPGFSMQTDSDVNPANHVTQTLTFDNNDVSGGHPTNAVSARPNVSINVGGDSDVQATVTDNDIKSAAGAEMILNTLASSTSDARFDAFVSGNDIGDAQPGNLDNLTDGGTSIWGWQHGDGVARLEIRSNTVQNWGGRALELSHNDGNGTADYTLTNNVFSNPDQTANTYEGMYAFTGAVAGDQSNVCIDMDNNDFDGIGRQGVSDLALDRFGTTQLRFAGVNSTSVPTLQAQLRTANPLSPNLTVETYGNPQTATAATTCSLAQGTPANP